MESCCVLLVFACISGCCVGKTDAVRARVNLLFKNVELWHKQTIQ